MAYKTPGVYVEEISLFPPSVAEVATAIPAFIGYTEMAVKKGEDLTNKPTRITSFLEYKQYFGGDATADIAGTVDTKKNYAVEVEVTRLYMYESLQLFFDNGGGPCYIVSVGDYDANPDQDHFKTGLEALEKFDEPTMILMPDAVRLDPDKLHSLQQLVLAQCGKLKDRVGVFDLPDGDLADVVDAFRDGIGVKDLRYGAAYAPWIITSYDKEVPFSVLKTLKDQDGNAFDPKSLFPADSEAGKELAKLVDEIENQSGQAAGGAPDANAVADKKTVDDKVTALAAPDAALADRFKTLSDDVGAAADDAAGKAKLAALFTFLRNVATGVLEWRTKVKGAGLLKAIESAAAQKLKPAMDALVAMEKNTEVEALLGRTDANVTADYGPGKYDDLVGAWISRKPADTGEFLKHYSNDAAGAAVPELNQAQEIAKDVAPIFAGLSAFVKDVQDAATAATAIPAATTSEEEEKKQTAATQAKRLQDTLYSRYPAIGNMVRQITLKMSEMPPGAAVAGVYAYVDSTRGVWKAPANVSLSQVLGPVERVDDATQENLNVDVVGGKSINVIRSFAGRGTLIWGARTLAGNDNEWRYVNVRRFFNMVEESVKKSTFWAVFEPNSAPLWVKVKGMIENYLIQKWRDGALAGARPDDAFFVKVGLGQTMTAQDILEGRLNVEIGMAVVRPAEFIILKFSHMMQKS